MSKELNIFDTAKQAVYNCKTFLVNISICVNISFIFYMLEVYFIIN